MFLMMIFQSTCNLRYQERKKYIEKKNLLLIHNRFIFFFIIINIKLI